MSRDRFKLILKYLHFCDNDTSDSNDPIYKFRHILQIFLEIFQSNYIPEKDISIDVSLRWKRYIPLKKSRFGMKCLILSEAKTGYVWNIESLYR